MRRWEPVCGRACGGERIKPISREWCNNVTVMLLLLSDGKAGKQVANA